MSLENWLSDVWSGFESNADEFVDGFSREMVNNKKDLDNKFDKTINKLENEFTKADKKLEAKRKELVKKWEQCKDEKAKKEYYKLFGNSGFELNCYRTALKNLKSRLKEEKKKKEKELNKIEWQSGDNDKKGGWW